MPQASDELRATMERQFGDPVDEQGPIKFLEDAGYKFTRNWFLQAKPGCTGYKDMTDEEYECLLFLIHEWDFGGLVNHENTELA